MSNHAQRIAELTAEKRQLLERLLHKNGPRYNVFPLSFAQQRMWFLHQAEPQSPFYNVALKLRLRGTLVTSALEQAIREIVCRHEVFRTNFIAVDGSPVQVIRAQGTLSFRVIDLSEIAAPEREAQAELITKEEATRPFDLERVPLLRTFLLRLDAQDHVLLLCTHHIVVDGWAVGVLLRELASLYEAYVADVPSPLPPLRLQYADYAQRQLSDTKVYATQLTYWMKHLSGSNHILALPADRPRPSLQTYRGAHEALVFSKELTESLESLAQQEGVTLFMVLLAGYEALLYRHTGQTDISVGTPVSGRNHPDLENLIGLFSNTVVLRCELSGALSFRELLGRIRKTCLAAYTHQDFPFDKLVEILQPERDPTRHPIVQATFSLQHETLVQQTPLKPLTLPGLAFSVEWIDTGTVQFDLILTVKLSEGEMIGGLSYNQDLFDAERISRMLNHYRRLLEGAVAAPDTVICELPLLGAEERQSLLRQSSGPRADFPRDLSLMQLFETQAALTPSAPAFTSRTQRLTFKQLDDRANQLARYLRTLGFGPDSFIGLSLRGSVESVVALLGILKAGAIAVPLAPATSLQHQLEGLELSALFIEDANEAATQLSPTTMILGLEADRIRINQQSTKPFTQVVGPESPAYLLPRATADGSAISVSHRTVQNSLRWFHDMCALGAGDAVLHRSSLAPDASVWELLWPLLYGGCVVSCAATESDFASVCRVVAEQQVKVMRVVASEMKDWMIETGEATRSRLSSLHLVICSGEPVAEETIEVWRHLSSATVCQCRAMPGTDLLATLSHNDDAFAGYPINNVAIVILNEAGQMMPLGVTGEVCAGGVALSGVQPFRPGAQSVSSSSGLRRMRNSFSEITGTHLWRTGERGRWLADGRLRIEDSSRQAWIDDRCVVYEEVEATLLAQPNVQECAVRSRQGRNGTLLVAYLVYTGKFIAQELSRRLSKQLAAYQVPQVYVRIPALPLTDQGDVDEASLARMAWIEDAELHRLEERLREVHGIEDAAVVMREAVEPLPELHISDLVADNTFVRQRRNSQGEDELDCDIRPPALTGVRPFPPGDTPPSTLGQVLRRAAQDSSHGLTYVSGREATHQTYRELLRDATRVCSWLSGAGARSRNHVILQLDDNVQFLTAFWGCVLGGLVPVPLATAVSYQQESSAARMLENVWELLEGPLVVSNRGRMEEIRGLLVGHSRRNGSAVRVIGIEEVAANTGAEAARAEGEAVAEGEVALLLFTSGSTGKPKGVMLTHHNIISMSRGIADLNGYTKKERTINWMPLTHVGGLVMFHLRDVFLGCHQIHARTDDILLDPLRWLDLIEEYGATVTWAPNFAFKLVNDQTAKIQLRRWDLSTMRLIPNGGEVVNAQTAMTFLSLLAKDGLAPTAMRPGFGMSETSSSIISSEILTLGSERGLQKIHVDSGNRVRRSEVSRATTFVEVGVPACGLQVRIVDAENRVLAEDTVGRLQVRGPQVTPGYFKNPAANREAFCDDGWFNTGDLGFLHQGRLTVTGREKDVIIVNGANYYSLEIEAIVEEIEGVETSYTAACAVREEGSDTDKLAIFFNPHLSEQPAQSDLIRRIRERVARSAGINPDYVLPLEKSEIPKTSIGKIQRSLLKQRFEQGEFSALIKEFEREFAKANTLPDWFSQQVWVAKRIRHLRPQLDPAIFLVFVDQLGLGDQLCGELKRLGNVCIRVGAGPDFFRESSEHYRLDPASRQHYQQLVSSLARDGMMPQQVLHLWAYEYEECASLAALQEAEQRGFYSVLWLVQALAQESNAANGAEVRQAAVQLNVVTCQAQASRPHSLRAFQYSSLPGLLKSVTAELPWLSVRHLDLEAEDAVVSAVRILEELRVIKGEAEISYRAGERLVSRLQKIDMPAAARRPFALRPGGLYLITGGLGGIGSHLAEYLLKHYDIKLLLMGRTVLPESDPPSELSKASERLGRLRVLEAAGASGSCLYCSVDVCDLEGLRRAVDKAERQWACRLDGVFHLAGEENVARHWQEMNRYWTAAETLDHVAATLRAKVSGTWALFELLKERRDALFVGFSSVNSIFGAATYGAYAAANSFLDGFTTYQREHVERARTWNFNWTMWDELGMSAGGPEYARELARSLGYCVMSARQGTLSLLAGLSRQPMNLIVGMDASNEQVGRKIHSRKPTIRQLIAFYTSPNGELTPSASAVKSIQAGTNVPLELRQLESLPRQANGTIDKEQLETTANARESAQAFQAPHGEVEKQLVEVWKNVLEVEQVGVNDKFFELGGSSLKSLKLLAAVNQRFSCQLAVVDIFKFSTVKALSSHIEKLRSNGSGKAERGISGFEF